MNPLVKNLTDEYEKIVKLIEDKETVNKLTEHIRNIINFNREYNTDIIYEAVRNRLSAKLKVISDKVTRLNTYTNAVDPTMAQSWHDEIQKDISELIKYV